MFKNYMKIALVNLKKHKAFSLINILGLAIGIACCILISAYVFHELSYDRFHDNADNIYRLKVDLHMSGEHLNIPKSSLPMAEYIVKNYPEVLDAARFRSIGRIPVRYRDSLYYEDSVFFADNSIFDVFTFPLIRGSSLSALETPYSVVITEDMAQKYFGAENPLGRVLNLNNRSDYTVTGVVKNFPQNSHLDFNMLCSFATYEQNNPGDMQNWLSINNYTYILLKKGYDYRLLELKLPEMVEKNMGPILKATKAEVSILLQPLTSIHLHSNLVQEISGNSNIAYVYIFSIIALFVLAIACINFMNLSTARSASRAQEVGVRKVFGANRGQVIRQFLFESIFFCLLSLGIALLLVELTLPLFKAVSGIELSIDYAQNLWLIPSLIGLTIFVGLMAGSYPAFFLSAYQPVKVIKGLFKAGTGSARFRSILVVVQFSISIVLIIGTIIVFNQLNYMKNSRLGFHKEQIVVIPISDESTIDSLRGLKEELRSHKNILSVAASSHVPGQTTFVNPFIPEGFSFDNMQYMGEMAIDHEFIPTMGIEMAAGRNFSEEFQTDFDQAVIINETAVKRFGWDDPIGKTIQEPRTSMTIRKRTVIGVVKDFHYESLHKRISPLHITYTSHWLDSLSVRIVPEDVPATLSFLSERMRQFDPSRPFQYSFLDDSFDAQYRAEERLSKIFSYFSILAIFIACLGLFGLSSFTAEQKTKEIGIRKVLGASVSGIVALLSKQFTKWVLVGNAIAWPIAYYALSKWLEGFAYRTALPLGAFVFAALISLAIALITVSYQSIRAATANPVKSLRYE